jgi:hypothetical protein
MNVAVLIFFGESRTDRIFGKRRQLEGCGGIAVDLEFVSAMGANFRPGADAILTAGTLFGAALIGFDFGHQKSFRAFIALSIRWIAPP